MKSSVISMICLGACFYWSILAIAQNENNVLNPLTLRQCLNLARQNNLKIHANEKKTTAAATKVGQALSFYFPSLDIEAGYTILDQDRISEITLPNEYYNLFTMAYIYFRMKADIENGLLAHLGYPPGTDPYEIINDLSSMPSIPPEIARYYIEAKQAIPRTIESGYLGKHYFGSTFSLTQPLFTGGKISGRYQQALWNQEAEEQKKIEVRQQTLAQVCETYYRISQGQELLALAEEMQSRFKMLKLITKALMQNRESSQSQYDYMTIQVYANKIDHLKQQMETKVGNGKYYLQLLLNEEQPITVKGNTLLPQLSVLSFDDSLVRLKQYNPIWLQLERGRLIAAKEVQVARAELLPLVGITGKYTLFYEEPDFGYMQDQSWEVMLGAQWHFPLGLQTLEAVKDKQAEYEAVAWEVEFAQAALTTRLKTLLQEIASSQQQLVFMEKAVADAKERSQLAIEGYRIEEVKTRDVIEAQNEESEVRIEYWEVLCSYQKQLVEYAVLLGWELYELDYLD